jgi:hypothetical protein
MLLGTVASLSQEVPSGVRYKKATDEINRKAKDLLEQAFSKTSNELDLNATFGKEACENRALA